ncbi:MAG: DinB family protein [Gemmatimonadaceae bacterium]
MSFQLERAIQILERTPATVRALLGGLDEEWIRCTEGPETFSPFDNLGHLVDGEETDWMQRMELILTTGTRVPFTPYDRFRHFQRNKGRTLASLLDEFDGLRARNIQKFRSWQLTEEKLDLTGAHPGLGVVTLRQLIAAYVVHDLGHVAQISRVMAKQYRTEIGPWVNYLPVVWERTATKPS